jgi:hypothetical protein
MRNSNLMNTEVAPMTANRGQDSAIEQKRMNFYRTDPNEHLLGLEEPTEHHT